MAEKVFITPQPGPTSPLLQKVANQSWTDFGKTASTSAQEALQKDPRKTPTNPSGDQQQ